MKVLCYNHKKTGHKSYVQTNMDADAWLASKNDPDLEIEFIFDMESEENLRAVKEHGDFLSRCTRYGFSASDYKAHLRNAAGHELEFYGFAPRNIKYQCLLRDTVTGTELKATPIVVMRGIDAFRKT